MNSSRPSRSAARRPAWWRRLTLRDVLVFSLPPLALAVWLFGSAVLDYQRVRQYDDWWSNATSVRKFGWYRLRSALWIPRAIRLSGEISAEDPRVDALRISVDRSAWDAVERDVGAHWGEWIDAELIDRGRLQRARVRFRGDGSAHWTSEKKSLTVRLPRGDLYRGYRSLALSVKDVLPQYVVGSLAADFGLLAPDTAVVPVFLNDRFYGLHRFVEPVDESFLRRHLRMPGNVYRGDTAERGEYFKGVPRELFLNPYIWDRVAENDRPGAPPPTAMAGLIADLNGATFEDHQRLLSRLDRSELARLLALLLVAGDPYHMSGVHNQLWYEDPVSGLLHPIVWDLRLLRLGEPPQGSNVNRFWRSALRDPRLFDAALGELAHWLEEDRALALARERAERVSERHRTHFDYERLREGIVHPVGTLEETLATLGSNLEVLRGWTRDARCAFHAAPLGEGTWGLDLCSRGRAGADLSGLELEATGLEAGSAPSVRVWADADLDGRRGEGDREVPGRVERAGAGLAWTALAPEPLLPGCGGETWQLEPEPVAYRFFVEVDGASGLRPSLVPRHGGAVELEAWPAGEALLSGASWHPWRYRESEGRHIRLAGRVVLDETLVVGERDELVIEPGSELLLGPDVSILARGRVTALGEPERPIAVQAADPALPWGAFALQGKGASGSRFAHVRFERGGGALLERVEYKGMVDVHLAGDVVFTACEFTGNLRCDDGINVVRGEADLIDCRFRGANADSIDYDMSGGEIRGCVIEGSGNDGIDLMTCWPRIIGCTILDSGDKGISIGEASAPLVFATEITGCERGMEVKDGSEPLVLLSRLSDNRVGLQQNVKNWRYGASGHAKLVASIVAGNEVDLLQDRDARLTVLDSRPSPPPSGGEGPDAPADIAWALRAAGVAAAPGERGVPGEWRLEEPLAPVAEWSAPEGFGAPAGGWIAGEGIQRLGAEGGVLSARVRGAGSLGSPVEWDLEDGGREHVLVLEIAGEGLASAGIRLFSGGGEVRVPLALPFTPGPAARPPASAPDGRPPPDTAIGGGAQVFVYATVPLAPGRYEGLVLELRSSGLDGRLALRGWRLYSMPRGEGS